MDMRTMPKINEIVSRLGMGMMRLPTEDGVINEAAAQDMVDRLMDAGVTYYDTAFFYHDGKSEGFTGKALCSRYDHSRYTIATKLPLGEVEKNGGTEALFNGQMERLGVDYIDFYLLHGINYGGWQHAQRIGADKFLDEAKRSGRIRFKGFSFHGANEDFAKILDENDWDFVQIQLNYYDWLAGGAKELYDAAKERNLPIIVMEPVRGGSLHNCHPDVKKVFDEASPDLSRASWAMRWVGSLPGVDVVLSGMSSMEQVEDNLRHFSPLVPLTDADHKVIERAMDTFRTLPLIPCTQCNYCNKCPQSIEIPRLLNGYNDIVRFGGSWYMHNYRKWTPAEKQADKCTACGVCETACPQGINIIERLKEVYEKHTV